MAYDDLLCAACSGRVVDGGCPTCRVTRQDLPRPQLPASALLVLAAVMTVLLLLSAHL